MGPSALDREIGAPQSCVRGRQISRGRRCVPRQWQCRETAVRHVRRTPLGGGWNCPRSLAVAGCSAPLGCDAPHNSLRWKQGAPTYAPGISAGALTILRACVIRVTQLCQISQVCRKLARDARPAALATTRTPSDLSLVVVPSTQRVLGHATWARPCRIARKWSQTRLFSLLAQMAPCWAVRA